MSNIPDQSGKVAVVTGANSGLGLAASRELARKGATVVMAVRNLDKGRAAQSAILSEIPEAKLDLRELDLSSLESLRQFAAGLVPEYDQIDILLNNAGVMASPPTETRDGFELQVGTNHLGHFALTQALMPALSNAAAARIVTMSSLAYMSGRPLSEAMTRLASNYEAWQAYGDAKLANYQFGLELARRLSAAGSSVSSLVAHPGLSRTNLQVNTVKLAGAGYQGRLWQSLARWLGMTAERGVQSALLAATDPGAVNGEFYGPRWLVFGDPGKRPIRAKSSEAGDLLQMWQVSEAATNVGFHLGEAG
jgi:NAD(P)-dependent dehydrogenase (short-subunit alcohol dehydrogenase family)